MKKTNNKYRSNGNNHGHSNQIYSLNYKFDSNSLAGKFSGTALDLIKKYNELARDANNNNDIVSAEIFRQYAEHYRKIVTDINDKKAIRTNEARKDEATPSEEEKQSVAPSEEIKDTSSEEIKTSENVEEPIKKVTNRKKEFKIIEIKETKSNKIETEEKQVTVSKPRRTIRKNVEEAVAAV